MASLSKTPSYTTCKFVVSSLSSDQTEADFFVYENGGLVDSEYGVGVSSSKITWTASGLDESTTYDYEVALIDGTTFTGTFKTKTRPSFTINTPTPSSSSITSGDTLTITWTYSGTPDATYWYLLGSTGTSRSSATVINSKAVSGGSPSFSGTWTQTGTWHFWIVCANSSPTTSGTVSTSYCTVTVTAPSGSAISVFDGSSWIDNCTIYVFDGTNWVQGDISIYDGGWS